MVEYLRERQSRVAEGLGISQLAVSQLIQKGRKLEKEMGIGLP